MILALLVSVALGAPVAIAIAVRAAARTDEANLLALQYLLTPIVDAEPIPELVSVDEALAIVADARPSITCPDCGRTSWHPDDVVHGYCGACHAFTSAMRQQI